MKENTKKVFIKNFGCQMNVRDSEVVAGLLKQDDYEFVDEPGSADVVIFNTCSVRQHAEDKVWSEIGTIGRRKPKTKNRKPIIGLIGCMAQNHKDQAFLRSPWIDFVVGPSDIEKIPSILSRFFERNMYELKIWETDGLSRQEEVYHTGYYQDKEHAYVVISEGCSNFCSYCVVPYVRGPLHNRPAEGIINEITEAVAVGISKITLLGQNVNAYKTQRHKDTKSQVNFIDLLKTINKICGLKEFTFITSHPKDTTVELFKAMAECDKLKKSLHLPVQSGSDKILKLMNRGYDSKYYLELVDNYRKIVTGGQLSTDIIVGFPGESQNDFKETYDLVERVRFDSAYIFKYSPRPDTQALNLGDDVSTAEKEKRHKLVLDLQRKISKEKR